MRRNLRRLARRAGIRFWLLSPVFLCALLELGARALFHRDALFDRPPMENDVVMRREWLARHDARTPIHYRFDLFDPELGWIVKPGLKGVEAFDRQRLTTDAHGVRGGSSMYARIPGKIRVLLLGDSFTFGEEVGDADTYPAQLQRLLPRADVVNLGVHGYGHDQMLLYFRRVGAKYRPDIVLLGYSGFDMVRDTLSFRDYAKPRFRLDGGRLALATGPIEPPEDFMQDEAWRSRFLDLCDLFLDELEFYSYHDLWRAPAPRELEAERLTEAILDAMAADAAAIGAKFYVVQLPDRPNCAGYDEGFFKRYAAEHPGRCHSLYAFTMEQLARGAHLGFLPGGHWSAEGNRLVARGIARFLKAAEPSLAGAPKNRPRALGQAALDAD